MWKGSSTKVIMGTLFVFSVKAVTVARKVKVGMGFGVVHNYEM